MTDRLPERTALLLTYLLTLIVGAAIFAALSLLGATDQLFAFASVVIVGCGALSGSLVTVRYGDARRKSRN